MKATKRREALRGKRSNRGPFLAAGVDNPGQCSFQLEVCTVSKENLSKENLSLDPTVAMVPVLL